MATNEVKNNVEGVGTLELDYAVELRGGVADRTKMRMMILPYFDKP